MVRNNLPPVGWRDDFTARIADATFQVLLEQGKTGSFLDLRLALWRAAQKVVDQEFAPNEAWHAGERAVAARPLRLHESPLRLVVDWH